MAIYPESTEILAADSLIRVVMPNVAFSRALQRVGCKALFGGTWAGPYSTT